MERAVSDEAPVQSGLEDQLAAYWRAHGLRDEVLIQGLSRDCLHRARRLVVRVDDQALLRRAIEEAQRRFDHALASAMGLAPSNDPHPLAAARAALLLSGEDAGVLFRHDESTRALPLRVNPKLPCPTPPEAPLSMQPVPMDFWFFKSSER